MITKPLFKYFVQIILVCNMSLLAIPINNWYVRIGNIEDSKNHIKTIHNNDNFISYENFKFPVDINRGKYVITYKKTVALPKDLDLSDLTIFATPSEYPFVVYINNTQILKCGYPNTDLMSSNFKGVIQNIPRKLVEDRKNVFVVMQTFPEGNSVPEPDISIQNRREGESKAFWQSAFNYSFISGLTFLAFFVFIVYLAMWFGSNRSKMEYLYFSLASICVSVGYTNIVFSAPEFNNIPLQSISRAMYGLASVFLLMLVTAITGLEKKMEKVNVSILILEIICSTAILLQTEKYAVEELFQFYSSFLIFPTLILTMIIFAFNIRKKRDIRKWMVLIGFLILFITVMHDLYYYKSFTLPYFWAIAYGYSFLELSILLVLAGDLWNLFEENKNKAASLKEKNIELGNQADKIKALSKTRESFLNTMAHELRTPLQGLLSSTELLDQENRSIASNLVNDQFQNYLRNINNIIDLSTTDMLSISKGSLRFSPEVSINSLISRINSRYKEYEIFITLEYDAKVPQLLSGDKERYLRILDNILSTGINQFTSGNLVILISYDDKKLVTTLNCSDGLYFSPDLFSHISKNSNVLDHSTLKNVRDLSLSAIYKLISALNGEIKFINDMTLEFSIPLEVVNLSKTERIKGNKILIVEDNKVNQLVIMKILQKAGYEISLAQNGIEGVEAILKEQPNLVIMDVQMPKLDGIKATEQIRSNPEIPKNLPIIALTAHASMQECIDAGMNDYLSKPVNSADLIKKIETYLKHSNS